MDEDNLELAMQPKGLLDGSGELAPLSDVSARILRLTDAADAAFLESLKTSQPGLQLFDEIGGQLRELVKSLQPWRKMSCAEVDAAVVDHLQGVEPSGYGVWVYYPWSQRVVHLLDEPEFAFLRTNRNCNKITKDEQAVLSKKKVGIVGLSVGQSIATTLAMERSFGEIRLADFDLLELTNLNRIRSGVHNLGVPKVVLVAREIAEIDPFLKTVCFPNGVTQASIDAFFLDGGKLDAVVDECDSLDVKVLCRQKARELQVPVIMDSSDRGTLDVERFDLEPDRPLLHGFLGGLDMETLSRLKTNEEKVPYLLAFAGIDTVSTRMKASMLEIEQTLSTWPQLASAVVLGGALGADVYRRVMLDQLRVSGRFHVDLEEIIADAPETLAPPPPSAPDAPPSLPSTFDPGRCEGALVLGRADVERLVAAAVAAPSGANAQPWLWVQTGDALVLFYDDSRAKGYMPFRGLPNIIGLGAALENLVLEAHALGLEVRIETGQSGMPESPQTVVAVVRFFEAGSSQQGLEPHVADELVTAIPARCTTRRNVPRSPIDPHHLEALATLVASAGQAGDARLWWATGEAELRKLGDLIGESDRLRILHPQAHYELFERELKWTREEAERSRDGIDIATFELTPSEHAGFRVARDPRVIAHLNRWGGGKGFEKLSRKAVVSASAMGMLTLPGFDTATFLRGGRLVERVWLAATQRGLALQPLTTLLTHLAWLEHGEGEGMTESMQREVATMRRRLLDSFGLKDDIGEPIFLFRLLIGEPAGGASLRLPLSEVLHALD